MEITRPMIDAYKAKDRVRLHRLLGLKPWQINPLDAHKYGPDNTPVGYLESLPAARAMRRRLEKACDGTVAL